MAQPDHARIANLHLADLGVQQTGEGLRNVLNKVGESYLTDNYGASLGDSGAVIGATLVPIQANDMLRMLWGSL